MLVWATIEKESNLINEITINLLQIWVLFTLFTPRMLCLGLEQIKRFNGLKLEIKFTIKANDESKYD